MYDKAISDVITKLHQNMELFTGIQEIQKIFAAECARLTNPSVEKEAGKTTDQRLVMRVLTLGSCGIDNKNTVIAFVDPNQRMVRARVYIVREGIAQVCEALCGRSADFSQKGDFSGFEAKNGTRLVLRKPFTPQTFLKKYQAD